MAQHPNITRLEELSAAWARGDMDAAAQFWTDDAVWRVPGRNVLAGTYRGRAQIDDVSRRFVEMSGGTLRLDPLETIADDGHIVVVWRATASRDGQTLDVEDANAILVDGNGKFTECWWLPNDQVAFDRFWQ